jgi:cholesterol oxidase
MSLWPNRGETDLRPMQGEAYVRLDPVPAKSPAVARYTHESAQL